MKAQKKIYLWVFFASQKGIVNTKSTCCVFLFLCLCFCFLEFIFFGQILCELHKNGKELNCPITIDILNDYLYVTNQCCNWSLGKDMIDQFTKNKYKNKHGNNNTQINGNEYTLHILLLCMENNGYLKSQLKIAGIFNEFNETNNDNDNNNNNIIHYIPRDLIQKIHKYRYSTHKITQRKGNKNSRIGYFHNMLSYFTHKQNQLKTVDLSSMHKNEKK